MPDLSNGYNDEAESFIANRSATIGVSVVCSWAQSFPAGTRVLELGCGDGIPITQTLLREGLSVYAIDASPKMVSAFHKNFPDTLVKCQAAEKLSLTEQQFDAALAWGLMFLLTSENQQIVIENISTILNSGGKFLFTSPREAVAWTDIRTGRKSVSLGASKYQILLSSVGMTLIGEYDDKGSNHYYEAEKQ
jgi:2-polyprenyl-3-methyl-5-hydroxy-6-metoxy-1,4-benzoquinol methylase